jgi:hypothetical protein
MDGIDYSCSLSRARFGELNMDYCRNSMGPVEKSVQPVAADGAAVQPAAAKAAVVQPVAAGFAAVQQIAAEVAAVPVAESDSYGMKEGEPRSMATQVACRGRGKGAHVRPLAGDPAAVHVRPLAGDPAGMLVRPLAGDPAVVHARPLAGDPAVGHARPLAGDAADVQRRQPQQGNSAGIQSATLAGSNDGAVVAVTADMDLCIKCQRSEALARRADACASLMEAEELEAEFFGNSKQAAGRRMKASRKQLVDLKLAQLQLVRDIDSELASLVQLEALWEFGGSTFCLPCRMGLPGLPFPSSGPCSEEPWP